MTTKEFIKSITEASGVSGHEEKVGQLIEETLVNYCDEVSKDSLGNIIFLKKGTKGNNKIMLAAHMDEIGLMVKEIDKNGFIRFTNIGGVDQRTLLCQEVTIHGKEKIFGIIGVKPPHLTDDQERSKSLGIDELMIDAGFNKAELENKISIGDVVTVNRKMVSLKNEHIAAKALDDRAGIAVVLECLKELKQLKHDIDVYCVATVQEEVGTRGATTSTFSINPDIGIAIDVGFGRTPELNQHETIELTKGPALTVGPNIHPKIFEGMKTIAKEQYIDYQIEIATGHSGTDAWPMQVTRSGVATGVVSIPLRYMHTSVETLSLSDIEKSGKLLARFIISLNDKDMEDFLCY